jgi:hypothetical protein
MVAALGDDPHVAGECNLHTAPACMTVDGRDGDLRQCLERIEELVRLHDEVDDFLLRHQGANLRIERTEAEIDIAGSGQYDDVDIFAAAERFDEACQFMRCFAAPAVSVSGTRNRDCTDGTRIGDMQVVL